MAGWVCEIAEGRSQIAEVKRKSARISDFPRAMNTQTILIWMWVGFGGYWLLSAWWAKKTAAGEWIGWRLLRWAILGLVFTLLLSSRFSQGFLGRRFVPTGRALEWAGVGVTVAGLLLCMWARKHLGSNWSDKVALKVDHQLIRTGPYARLRHPIYSGMVLAIGGTALAVGQWRGVLALVILLVNYAVKAKREERILSGKFGERYSEYRGQAGFLLPKF
jgi:protein-S-isoprenylcysteine O-methyltransferase Ste14